MAVLADAVAAAMKDWAIENGATHYTHWFQPLTGLTAEKHDATFGQPRSDPEGHGWGHARPLCAQLAGHDLVRERRERTVFGARGEADDLEVARVHAEDRGNQFGDAIYEVCEVLGGRLIDEARHLKRLERSLRELAMQAPMKGRRSGMRLNVQAYEAQSTRAMR